MSTLAIGAAAVCTSGVASAVGLDFQISIDGYDVDIGNNTLGGDQPEFALAGVGDHDLAFIWANNSLTTACGDILDADYSGSNDTAFTFDPFGAGNDTVNAGINGFDTGNFDLGAMTTLGTETNALGAAAVDWWAVCKGFEQSRFCVNFSCVEFPHARGASVA